MREVPYQTGASMRDGNDDDSPDTSGAKRDQLHGQHFENFGGYALSTRVRHKR
jgi:hypothetical protein